MVGPEMELPDRQCMRLHEAERLTVYGFRGTGKEYLDDCLDATGPPNLAVLFNSGIGTKLAPLTLSWITTLEAMLVHPIPFVCFSFNEKELRGEQELLVETFGGRAIDFDSGHCEMLNPFATPEDVVVREDTQGEIVASREHDW